jgi:signal peptidase I
MRVFVFNVVKVEGISMEPTYYSNDILVINKLQTPSLNDVVVVKSPSNENNYIIKRITAVEGMTVFYNGKEITLKEDEYFLMGDNYYKSNDSRAFGPITHDKIIGVVDFKIR